jgi:multidrug efflux pump subunit AcrA (membrane-fusion protein)
MYFFSKILLMIFSVGLFANTPEYQIAVVQDANVDKRALLGGNVISSSVINLSAKVSGDVIKVNGKEGSYFKQGEVIVELEKEVINARRDAVIAEISNAKEAIRNAQVRYNQALVSPNSNQMFGGAFNVFTDPMNQMFGDSDPNFDKFAHRTERLTGLNQARNNLKQAEAKLKQIEEQLADSTVVAPFDGVVVAKSINNGDNVHIGQSLVEFSNLNQLQVEVDVPSRLIANLKIGKIYRIKVDTLNKIIKAKLSQIYPMADNNKHSIKVKLDLPENLPILPGVYAELELKGNTSAKLPSIPKSAIMWRLSLPSVFVVNKFNKTELKFVRLGDDIDNDNISVLSGLSIGQRIITNPNVFTTSGDNI